MMNILNDPTSDIYQNTLKKQNEFIVNRFDTIRRNRYLDDKCGLIGTKDTIIKHLNQGPAQNLILSFFNQKTNRCIFCNRTKDDNEIKQFERAHCNNYSRSDILSMAIDEIYIDENTPVIVGNLLKIFIQKHDCCPIYMLCNQCHHHYDNKGYEQ